MFIETKSENARFDLYILKINTLFNEVIFGKVERPYIFKIPYNL